MWRTFVAGFGSVLLTTCFVGCAMVQTDSDRNEHNEQPSQMDMRALNQVEAHFFHEGVAIGELDPQQLQPGQHVEILSGAMPNNSGDQILIHTTIMAGTVKEIVGDKIVLSDVVLVNEARKQTGVPIVNKVPYFSRLFKNTGVARSSGSPIPGEVTIERSKILNVHELTREGLASLSGTGGYERIGVDFDFPDAIGEPIH